MTVYVRYRLTYKIWCLASMIAIFAVMAQPAFAGKLDDFEQDATEEEDEQDDGWLYFEDEEDDDDGSILGDILGGIFNALFSGIFDADDDGDSLQPSDRGGQSPGNPFESNNENPLLPLFTVDMAYQNVDTDVGAFDTRVEVGLGVLAAQGRFTWYLENEPSDDLGMYQLHGLFRLPLGEHLKIGVGAGALIVDGNNQNSGFSTTVPILIAANDVLGFEFRPTWSWINENRLDDFDLCVSLNYEFAAVRLGYRTVQSEHESLDGLYAGFSLKF